jgi:hypothetical protein
VYYSSLLDAADGSAVGKYVVSAVGGTVGLDGRPARAVRAVRVDLVGDVDDGLSPGQEVDVVLDRPMTPYPARYAVAVTGLYSGDLTMALDPTATTAATYGVHLMVAPPSTDPPGGLDFANPQSALSVAGLPNPGSPSNLGVFVVDDSGDYAVDDGVVSYKKRVLRRILVRPGSFVHLRRDYGAGLAGENKRLGTAAEIQRVAVNIEQQVRQEPETARCRVTAAMEPGKPLLRVTVLAEMRTGQQVRVGAVIPVSV